MLIFFERTERAVISQTNAGTVFQKQCWKNFKEIGWSAHRLFQVHVLNWTDLINLQARPTVLPADDCVSSHGVFQRADMHCVLPSFSLCRLRTLMVLIKTFPAKKGGRNNETEVITETGLNGLRNALIF